VSDPTSPSVTSNITLHDGIGFDDYLWTRSLAVNGKYVFIGAHTESGSESHIEVFDVSSSTNPVMVNNWIPSSANDLSGFRSLVTSGSYLYMVGCISNNLAILDIGSLETANVSAGQIKTDNLEVQQHAQFDQDILVHGGLNVGHNALIGGALAITGIASSTLQANNTTPSLWIQSGKAIIGTSTMAVATSTNIPSNSLLVTNGIICVDNGGGNNCASSARTAGNIYAEGSSLGGLDLAETYPTKDDTLTPGEVVMLDPENPVFVTRYSTSTTETPPAPLGIISTQPGVLLGGFKTSPEFVDEEHVSLALTGRVPTFVTDENGSIEVGDRIAVSQSIDGMGTKAVHTGYTVGVALEAFTSEEHASTTVATTSILVFVDPQYYFADTQVYVDSETGYVGIGTTTPLYDLHVDGEVAAQAFINVSTRDAKKDITYLTDEDRSDALTDIRNLKLAHYHYTDEDEDAPLRFGLIAEESPEEVLSLSGKGVDLYKLNALTLAGVQELSQKVTALERALGISLSDLDTTVESPENNSLLAVVLNGLKSLGVTITDHLVRLTKTKADMFTVGSEISPSGMQLYNDADGSPYCVRIHNGELTEVKGLCTATPLEEETTPTPTPEVTPDPVPESTPTTPQDTSDTTTTPQETTPEETLPPQAETTTPEADTPAEEPQQDVVAEEPQPSEPPQEETPVATEIQGGAEA